MQQKVETQQAGSVGTSLEVEEVRNQAQVAVPSNSNLGIGLFGPKAFFSIHKDCLNGRKPESWLNLWTYAGLGATRKDLDTFRFPLAEGSYMDRPYFLEKAAPHSKEV